MAHQMAKVRSYNLNRSTKKTEPTINIPPRSCTKEIVSPKKMVERIVT